MTHNLKCVCLDMDGREISDRDMEHISDKIKQGIKPVISPYKLIVMAADKTYVRDNAHKKCKNKETSMNEQNQNSVQASTVTIEQYKELKTALKRQEAVRQTYSKSLLNAMLEFEKTQKATCVKKSIEERLAKPRVKFID